MSINQFIVSPSSSLRRSNELINQVVHDEFDDYETDETKPILIDFEPTETNPNHSTSYHSTSTTKQRNKSILTSSSRRINNSNSFLLGAKDGISINSLPNDINRDPFRSTSPPSHQHQNRSPRPSIIFPSFFHSNFDENGYVFDGVKVEIEDIDNTSVSNITTQSLKRCKRQVLRHYYNLLCFIGWRPFYKERYYKIPCLGLILNIIYPIIIVLLLLYSYTYDIYTCQYKLNVLKDIKPITLIPAFTLAPNYNITTTTSVPLSTTNETNLLGMIYETINSHHKHHNHSSKNNNRFEDRATFVERKNEECGHVVTTYIVPSLMHLIAYIIGFFYFRVFESEHLYTLIEKVFLAVNQTMKIVSQNGVIKRLKLFLFCGLLWVALSMASQIFYRLAFGIEEIQNRLLCLVIQVIAMIIVNSVYLAVVINHATQVEMILLYTDEIKTRMEEKSISLKNAMQQILEVRIAIGTLNSTVAKMTTLVSVTFIVKFIIGLIMLVLNKNTDPYAWAYRVTFTITWFIILAFIIIQIARLNSKCSKFKQIALSARVYGYHDSTKSELDSFVLFIANARLRAKLMGVPLKTSYLLGFIILLSLTLIILFQASVLTTPNSFI